MFPQRKIVTHKFKNRFKFCKRKLHILLSKVKKRMRPFLALIFNVIYLILSNHQVHCMQEAPGLNDATKSGEQKIHSPVLDVAEKSTTNGSLRGSKGQFITEEQGPPLKQVDEQDVVEEASLGLIAEPVIAIAEQESRRSLSTISSSMQQLLNLVNNERTSRGLGALCFNDKLILAAQNHNNDMMQQQYFSHTGLDGSTMSSRVNAVNYNWSRLAENLAINSSVQGAHESLMQSTGHRKNILNQDLEQIGLAVETQTSGTYNGYVYVTQVFGTSNTESCIGSIDSSSEDTPSSSCSDSPSGWYDSDGPQFNCNWYASDPRYCSYYGSYYKNFDKTANQACCVCGGGSD